MMNRKNRPSVSLAAWVDQQLESQKPGFRFPPDRELASAFAVSERTVARLFKRYSGRGDIVRIPGKGTFIAGSDLNDQSRPLDPPKRSAENLADMIDHFISDGTFMRGRPLPQIKYLSLLYKVSPATVITAYRRLQQQGHVVKIGKSFWVGPSGEALMQGTRKEVVLFKYRSLDFSDIFSSDMLATAYRKMERELVDSGFLLRFGTDDAIEALFHAMVRKRTVPYGLIFFRMRPDAFQTLFPRVNAFLRELHKFSDSAPRTLVDWELGSVFDKIPKSIQILSRGHISTSVAKRVARHIIEKKHNRTTLFLDQDKKTWHLYPIAVLLKLWGEIKGLDMRKDFRTVFRPNVPGIGRELFCTRLEKRIHETPLKNQLYKYPDLGFPDLAAGLSVADDPEAAFPAHTDSSLWIMQDGAGALRACRWCERRDIHVPEDLSILSLENDADCYHRGISYCDPDWERIGYTMAHAITGMFPVEKSSKGFIRTRTRLVNRLTTR